MSITSRHPQATLIIFCATTSSSSTQRGLSRSSPSTAWPKLKFSKNKHLLNLSSCPNPSQITRTGPIPSQTWRRAKCNRRSMLLNSLKNNHSKKRRSVSSWWPTLRAKHTSTIWMMLAPVWRQARSKAMKFRQLKRRKAGWNFWRWNVG